MSGLNFGFCFQGVGCRVIYHGYRRSGVKLRVEISWDLRCRVWRQRIESALESPKICES
jgi:hypothetical protein